MTLEEAYQICVLKAQLHFKKLNGPLFVEPSETYSGDYYCFYPFQERFADFRGAWVTSMITGMAPLIYQTMGDRSLLQWSERFLGEYYDKVYRPFTSTIHDLGFLYLPYSVYWYQLTGNTKHRDIALKAADELVKRFNVRGHFIEAWDEMNKETRECRMIVDTTMNLALLYWAWKETGNYFYREVADAHLETAVKVLVREDASVAHGWFFDSETGRPLREVNSCGFDVGSHWSRGTAWLVYGLTIAYSYTKSEKYWNVAQRVTEKYLECLLDDTLVPLWDFRLPAELPARACINVAKNYVPSWDERLPENRKYNVDSSAAAIMACAFQLMYKLKLDESYRKYADKILLELANRFFNTDVKQTAMLTRCYGKDCSSLYGDYFFMLGLAMRLYSIKTCWENDDNGTL